MTGLIPAVVPHKRIFSPFPKMSYTDAMNRYGTDKPDLRFGMEIMDVSDAVRKTELRVFSDTLQAGGAIKCIIAPGCGGYSRKDLDVLTDFVRTAGAKGLATLAWTKDGLKGSVAKSLNAEEVSEIARMTGAKEGDLACMVADKPVTACKALGALRLEFRDRLKLRRPESAGLRLGGRFPDVRMG